MISMFTMSCPIQNYNVLLVSHWELYTINLQHLFSTYTKLFLLSPVSISLGLLSALQSYYSNWLFECCGGCGGGLTFDLWSATSDIHVYSVTHACKHTHTHMCTHANAHAHTHTLTCAHTQTHTLDHWHSPLYTTTVWLTCLERLW